MDITWSGYLGTQAGSVLPLAASVSSPRQVALLPRQLGLISSRQTVLVPSQGGMQAVQALNPRQAVFLPRQVALFPRQLGSVLPRQASQAPPTSSRNSPPKRGEDTLEAPKLKWVINVSSKPLTQAQRYLLAKRPNSLVTSGIHPI